MTPAEVATWTTASRAAQGLSDGITDPAILARIWTLAFAGHDPPSSRGPARGPYRDGTSREPSKGKLSPSAETGQEGTPVRRGGGGYAR
jgi:hypothetical protein